MRAIVLDKPGGPEALQEKSVRDPAPGLDEALVRVAAAGVCGRDLIDRRGGFPAMQLPAILGHEFAGEIVQVGAHVADLAPGDRVANLLRASCGKCRSCTRGEPTLCERAWQSFGHTVPGGYAELVVAHASTLVKVPAEIPFVEAAPMACTAGVATRALRSVGGVRMGDQVLVTGASGGVGSAAVQIAKLMGARVVAVTSSAPKVDALRALGADEVVVSTDGAFQNDVKARTGGGVDCALELTGSPTFGGALRSLRSGGTLVLVGNIPTQPVSFNPGAAILFGYRIAGSAGCTRVDLEDCLDLRRRGKLAVKIDRVLPLARAAEAHALLAERKVVGRVVLTP